MKKIFGVFFFLLFIVLALPNARALSLPKPPGGLSSSELVSGLKEALVLGAKTAANLASQVDGFYKNPEIFIPFPPEAKAMKQTLETIGLKKPVEDFVKTLNRAAEEAAKKAAPIFLKAIKELTIQDGYQILRGPNDAATQYLRRKTSSRLHSAFRPVVRKAIAKVGVTQYWNPLVKRYNQIPFVKRVNPNLDSYVTERAISGLFKLMADEERKIRKDPAARVTDILRRVFGS